MHARYLGFVQPRFVYLAVVLILLMSVSIWVRGVAGKPLSAVATTLLGVLYTGGLLSFGYALRYHDYAVGGVRIGGFRSRRVAFCSDCRCCSRGRPISARISSAGASADGSSCRR